MTETPEEIYKAITEELIGHGGRHDIFSQDAAATLTYIENGEQIVRVISKEEFYKMPETPEEMYARWKGYYNIDDPQRVVGNELWQLINHYRKQVQVLKEALEKIKRLDDYTWGRTTTKALAATEDKWGE